MPRIPRLRRPLSLSAPREAARCRPLPRRNLQQHHQSYHATAATRQWTCRSAPLAHARLFSTSSARCREVTTRAAVDGPAEPESVEALKLADEAALAAAETGPESSLVVPGPVENAPRPGEIGDAAYVPAQTGDYIEQVGGLDGWWEDDRHWDPAVEFRGFAPVQRVADPVLLELLARQAVLEAVAVQAAAASSNNNSGVTLTGAWSHGGRDGQRAALALDVVVGEDGSVQSVQGDAAAVVAGLSAENPVKTADAAALDADEARGLLDAHQDATSWKRVSLADPALKFAIAKRILQLTGHLLPDGQLVAVDSVDALLGVLVRPPKPKTLAEDLQSDGSLAALPNVAVYGRRVTPIDKHKQVGRWKVIVAELEKRGLPVTGTGGHDRIVERKWMYN